MDLDILQSTLDDLSHLLIPPSQLNLEGAAEIGVGGYGRVFSAVLESSDSQIKVAVKQLRVVQIQEVRRRAAIRLARELKVWDKAKHPNILGLLGFSLSDDCLCAQFVSAYMANGNVKEYIDRLQPNVATRLGFVQGLTSGMTYLHNCNPAICHGDLKPTNVLVDDSLNVVLCDFGLATFVLEAGVSSGLTTSKSPKGSIRYMAPELLLEGEAKYTLESDVWAWACTAFEVLTGREPFPDAKREEAVVTAIVLGRPPGSVDLLDGLVSDGHITYRPNLDSMKSIIPDCWVRDSAKRPPASEILDRLISSNGIEALDTATASSHLSATENPQPKLLSPPSTGFPTHGNVKKKRKGSPGVRSTGPAASPSTSTLKHMPSSRPRRMNDTITTLVDQPPSHDLRGIHASSEWAVHGRQSPQPTPGLKQQAAVHRETPPRKLPMESSLVANKKVTPPFIAASTSPTSSSPLPSLDVIRTGLIRPNGAAGRTMAIHKLAEGKEPPEAMSLSPSPTFLTRSNTVSGGERMAARNMMLRRLVERNKEADGDTPTVEEASSSPHLLASSLESQSRGRRRRADSPPAERATRQGPTSGPAVSTTNALNSDIHLSGKSEPRPHLSLAIGGRRSESFPQDSSSPASPSDAASITAVYNFGSTKVIGQTDNRRSRYARLLDAIGI